MNNRITGIAGDVEHPDGRRKQYNLLGQLTPIHAWHDDICNQQPDIAMVLLTNREPLLGIAGHQDLVAAMNQN